MVVAVAWFVMSATIGTVGCGIAHVDTGADGVAVADDESPRTTVPCQRAVEIRSHLIALVLEGSEHILQVDVAALPVDAIDGVAAVDAVEIVEIDFIHSFVLFQAQSEFVCHLVAQEEGFSACLRVWECGGGDGYHHHHGQGQKFFHLLMIFYRLDYTCSVVAPLVGV